MGFNGGNSGGGGGNTVNTTIKHIPVPKIESLKVAINGVLPLRVYSDLQEDTTWRDFNPKIYLFRYKTRKTSKKLRLSGNHDTIEVPARWAHPNAEQGKTSIWDVDTTNIVQNQQNINGLQLRRNGATLVQIVLNEWFRPLDITQINRVTGLTEVLQTVQKSRQSNYSNAIDKNKLGNIRRKAEYFKFAYVLEKQDKFFVGEMSTQTVKVKYENYANGHQAVAKLV